MILYDVLIGSDSLPYHPIISNIEDTQDEDIYDKITLTEI